MLDRDNRKRENAAQFIVNAWGLWKAGLKAKKRRPRGDAAPKK